MRAFASVANYITINVSSPNTPGLRNLQTAQALEDLLTRIAIEPVICPVLLKIAPDLADEELADIVTLAQRHVDGLIVSNTTISRDGLESMKRGEMGGLSGRPLFQKSTRMLAKAYQLSSGKLPLIGVGGIGDVQSAWQKMEAGASLIQLYSALAYQGPRLITEINTGLAARARAEGLDNIDAIIGRHAAQWAQSL
jgi:dihydroorotate dehydrogenase